MNPISPSDLQRFEGFIRYLARAASSRLRTPDCGYEDYVQIGYLAVLTAAKNFDSQIGCFDRYAKSCVRKRIAEAMRSAGFILSAPHHIYSAAIKIRQLRRHSSDEQIMEQLRLPEERYLELLTLVGRTGGADRVESDESVDGVVKDLMSLSTLTQEEREVLDLATENRSIDIANKLGRSPSWVTRRMISIRCKVKESGYFNAA